jgi:HEXXH motif-containing protein
LITTHTLPEEAFAALASGGGDAVVVQDLCAAQLSQQIMLLHIVAEAACNADPRSPEVAAFLTAFELLATMQAADPDAVTWLLSLPQFSAWAHDCFFRLDQGQMPDYVYLAASAASAAIRSGAQFELDVPVRDGRLLLPGLGSLIVSGRDPWLRLRGDGVCLHGGALVEVPYAALAPDDGSSAPMPYWQGIPLVRAAAGGQAWDVLLETADSYLNRYAHPMCTTLTAEQAAGWRRNIQAAWEILVLHHGWAYGPVGEGVSVIVPLVPRSDTDLESATTPSAFGAISTSMPPSPIIMAETLVHEFQHLKLCALMDMVPLIEHGDERVYAAWRQDPRPASGLLQGVYAHLGVARFWSAQRHVETEPDGILRAEVTYERWRRTIESATSTLLQVGCLTEDGFRFVAMLRDQGRILQSEPVSAEAMEIAREVALDHALTWQLRHTAIDVTELAELAAAYRRGEPLREQALPRTWIAADTRKADSTVRSRLLSMRYLDPGRFRDLCAAGVPGLSDADALLIQGNPAEAAREYGEMVVAATDAQPDAWIGLALATSGLAGMSAQQAFTTRLPLMFEVHAYLRDRGLSADPLELAAWFT